MRVEAYASFPQQTEFYDLGAFPEAIAQALLVSEWWDYAPPALWRFGFRDPAGFCARLADAKAAGTVERFEPRVTIAADLLADLPVDRADRSRAVARLRPGR